MKASITPISRRAGAHTAKPDAEGLQRVVLQFGDRALRGHTDQNSWNEVTDASAEQIRFRPLGSDAFEETSLAGLKAVFFVKRFDGPGLDEMRFHDHADPQASLWVRVVFRDGEIIEGLVDNRADYLLQPGFLLTPTDPEANHWLIYIAKGQLSEFQVLGLRSALKN